MYFFITAMKRLNLILFWSLVWWVNIHVNSADGEDGQRKMREALFALLLLFLPCQAVHDVSNWLTQ